MTQTDYYDQYAEFYDNGEDPADDASKAELLKGTIQRLNAQAKSILEIACGTGNILEPLSAYYEVTGLDLSPKMLDVARKKLTECLFSCRRHGEF